MTPLTFWSQQNPYSEYVRCAMPAKELGGQVRNIDAVRLTGLDPVEVNEGAAVWQILANGSRLAWVEKMMQAGIPCLLEVDDSYVRWSRHSNRDWVPGLPTDPLTASVALHRKAASLLDGVIVSTPALAEVYGRLNKNVHVCPNSADLVDWFDPAPRDDVFRIVWMASAAHRGDESLILSTLEWAAQQEGVEAYLFGAHFPTEHVRHVPWVSSPQEYRDALVALRPDVGLCPVERDDFASGKSDLKALEYAMAGAMPVVTDFEPYAPWLAGAGQRCQVAATPDDWAETVRWCVEHRDAVRQMGEQAREYVLAERTIEDSAGRWIEAAESVLVAA